ncbi:MAG: hypothetical protein DLM73_08725 [Chthoniobacterales bacterium]|nr:MAG: hypothetical protein DLM73_08725 [Chthoniobacterales bacterium]
MDAVDSFIPEPNIRVMKLFSISFGGIATIEEKDNSDILTSRKIQQRVLDILDEPPPRKG